MARSKREAVPRLSLITLNERIDNLENEIDVLKREFAVKKTVQPSKLLNKVESFNGEEVPEQKEPNKLKMNEADRLVSVKNACMILPPNMKVDGRHTTDNVSAICGFKVDEETLDLVYTD